MIQSGLGARTTGRGLACALTAGALVLAAGSVAPVSVALAQDEAAAAPAAPAERVQFSRFAEPVDLRVLIDYISEQLGVNILIDPSLTGQSVAFSGPMEVDKSQLFELLQLVLGPSGFVVTFEEDLKAYVIRPTANVPLNLGGEIPTTEIIPTGLVKPSALTAALEQSLGSEKDSLRLAYIDELSAIISTGSPRANRNLRIVVDQLLAEYRDQKWHRFDLENIAATEARDRILELVGQRAAAGGAVARPGPAGAGANAAPAAVGGSLTNLAEKTIIDRQGNAIIFRGSAAAAEEFAQFVALVDQPSRLIVRRYSAGLMARQIASYGEKLGLGTVTSGGGGTGGAPGAGGGAGAAVGAGSGFVIEDEQAGVFTYYGTEAQHKQVAKLVDDFAGQTRPDAITVQFYKLRHANAEAVVEVVQSVIDGASASSAGGPTSPFLPQAAQRGRVRTDNITRMSEFDLPGTTTQTEGQASETAQDTGGLPTLTSTENISVIADVPNNQVIVKATVRQQNEIRAIIDRIDQRRPQVFIQVRIVSVSRDEQFSLQVETAFTDPNSDIPIFTNFGLTDSGSPDLPDPDLAGITAAIIYNDYLPIIINALQTDTDLRTEAAPYLLVNDNEEGSLNSTREQSFSQTNQSAGSVATTSVGGSVSAGTVLTITPQISEGGYIKLEYEIELSSFIPGTRSATLPSDRQTNNFSSLVSVPSGSTVVVGGFAQEDVSNQSSGVPFFKDLPLIGWLFQTQGKMNANRTIYVFITPQIVRDPTFSDLRLLTQGPMAAVGVELGDPTLEPANMPIVLSAPAGRAEAGEDPS